MERNKETRVDDEGAEKEDAVGDPDDIGSALSFALRLRNKNRGASQTQIPKNEAISVNPGVIGPPPR